MLHIGTAPRSGGIPVNMPEALEGGARRAGREFACCGGGNVAADRGDVRRLSPRPRCRGGGHASCCRTEQARSAWRE